MLFVVTAASFTWSVVQTADEPSAAYFSTLTRAWELGLGAMVALVSPALLARIGPQGGSVLAVLGLGAIVAACIGFTSETPFPGYAAALPVVGTALLLLAGAGTAAPVTWPLLDNRVMRTVGDWSVLPLPLALAGADPHRARAGPGADAARDGGSDRGDVRAVVPHLPLRGDAVPHRPAGQGAAWCRAPWSSTPPR